MCNQVDNVVIVPKEKGPFSNLKQLIGGQSCDFFPSQWEDKFQASQKLLEGKQIFSFFFFWGGE